MILTLSKIFLYAAKEIAKLVDCNGNRAIELFVPRSLIEQAVELAAMTVVL